MDLLGQGLGYAICGFGIKLRVFGSGFKRPAIRGNTAREKYVLYARAFRQGIDVLGARDIGVEIFVIRMPRFPVNGRQIKDPGTLRINYPRMEVDGLADIQFYELDRVGIGSLQGPDIADINENNIMLDIAGHTGRGPELKIEIIRRALAAVGSGEQDLKQTHYEKIIGLCDNKTAAALTLPAGTPELVPPLVE